MMGLGSLEKVMTYLNYRRNVELSTDGGEHMGKTYHKAHVNLKSARGERSTSMLCPKLLLRVEYPFPSFWEYQQSVSKLCPSVLTWGLRLVHYSPWADFVLAGKISLEHSHTICLHIVYSCFCTISTEWGSCDRDCVDKIPTPGHRNLVKVTPAKDNPQLRLLMHGHKYLVISPQLGKALKAVLVPALRTQS